VGGCLVFAGRYYRRHKARAAAAQPEAAAQPSAAVQPEAPAQPSAAVQPEVSETGT